MGTLNCIIDLFLLFLTYSIIGWMIEVTFVSLSSKKFINRGFLIGPYCPIYGCGGLAISLLLKNYTSDYIVTFVLSSVIASVIEYITSFLMEKLFKARWWDYSKKKFNINGRVCLLNSIFFGFIGTIMLCFLTPKFTEWIGLIPQNIKYIISSILAVIFITDNIISFNIISSIKHLAVEVKKDSTVEITKKVKEVLLARRGLFGRLVKAFPSLKCTIEEKRQEMKKRRDEFILRTKQSISNSKNKIEQNIEETKKRFAIKK